VVSFFDKSDTDSSWLLSRSANKWFCCCSCYCIVCLWW